MGRLAAIDWGKVRIGLALSDERKCIASPFKTLKAAHTLAETIKLLILELQAIETLEEVIIGLPLKLSGEESPMSTEVRLVKTALEKELSCPIVLWDERLTTAGVERTLRESGVKRKKRAQIVDGLAAATILQCYLEHLSVTLSP